MTDFDYAIIGAGLAGLSLASSLVDLLPKKSQALIDPRSDFKRDHNWCYWNNAAFNIELPINKRWTKWKVSYKSKTTVCQSEGYPYDCVFADTYYKHALSTLNKSETVKFFLGESLEQVEYKKDSVLIKTGGHKFSAKILFDSRPPQHQPGELVQDFLGFHIISNEEVFDSECLTLMDFSGVTFDDSPGFHFYYVLPFDKKEALVESVFVGFTPLAIERHRRLIRQYLLDKFGIESFETLYTEKGCIPMHRVAEKSPHRRHYCIGTRGGLVRPSTGYAFAAIHLFSDRLAKLLQKYELPEPPDSLSAKSKILDTVLLRYLKTNINDGPFLLSSLFENVDPDVLVRFLCDCSSLQDDANIFAAMPRKQELSLLMAGMWL